MFFFQVVFRKIIDSFHVIFLHIFITGGTDTIQNVATVHGPLGSDFVVELALVPETLVILATKDGLDLLLNIELVSENYRWIFTLNELCM